MYIYVSWSTEWSVRLHHPVNPSGGPSITYDSPNPQIDRLTDPTIQSKFGNRVLPSRGMQYLIVINQINIRHDACILKHNFFYEYIISFNNFFYENIIHR